jgi:hypothetical protein
MNRRGVDDVGDFSGIIEMTEEWLRSMKPAEREAMLKRMKPAEREAMRKSMGWPEPSKNKPRTKQEKARGTR